MKIFYTIVFFVAFIAIVTFGLKRSNAFFRQNNKAGEVNYLTPQAEETPDTSAKKKEVVLEAYQESELSKVEEK